MTLRQIRAMFPVGSVWTAVNSFNPRVNGRRVIVATFPTQFQWRGDNGDNGVGGFTYWPMASQVLEARDGFISFRIHKASECNPRQNNWSVDDTLTLTRVTA